MEIAYDNWLAHLSILEIEKAQVWQAQIKRFALANIADYHTKIADRFRIALNGGDYERAREIARTAQVGNLRKSWESHLPAVIREEVQAVLSPDSIPATPVSEASCPALPQSCDRGPVEEVAEQLHNPEKTNKVKKKQHSPKIRKTVQKAFFPDNASSASGSETIAVPAPEPLTFSPLSDAQCLADVQYGSEARAELWTGKQESGEHGTYVVIPAKIPAKEGAKTFPAHYFRGDIWQSVCSRLATLGKKSFTRSDLIAFCKIAEKPGSTHRQIVDMLGWKGTLNASLLWLQRYKLVTTTLNDQGVYCYSLSEDGKTGEFASETVTGEAAPTPPVPL